MRRVMILALLAAVGGCDAAPEPADHGPLTRQVQIHGTTETVTVRPLVRTGDAVVLTADVRVDAVADGKSGTDPIWNFQGTVDNPGFTGARLIDPEAGRVYEAPAGPGGEICVCTTGVRFTVVKQTEHLRAAYAGIPATTTTLDVMLPLAGVFPDVPIVDGTPGGLDISALGAPRAYDLTGWTSITPPSSSRSPAGVRNPPAEVRNPPAGARRPPAGVRKIPIEGVTIPRSYAVKPPTTDTATFTPRYGPGPARVGVDASRVRGRLFALTLGVRNDGADTISLSSQLGDLRDGLPRKIRGWATAGGIRLDTGGTTYYPADYPHEPDRGALLCDTFLAQQIWPGHTARVTCWYALPAPARTPIAAEVPGLFRLDGVA
jgi:hypothetical protein